MGQESCVDVEHKKRGRPRIRSHVEPGQESARGAHRGQRHPIASTAVASQTGLLPTVPLSGPEPYRPLRSPEAPLLGTARPLEPISPGSVAAYPGPLESPGLPRPGPGSWPEHEAAVAYLQMNLVFARTTLPFCSTLEARPTNFAGRTILDFVVQSDWPRVERLRRGLQEEQVFRDPAYLAPIYGISEAEHLQQLPTTNLTDFTQGSQEWLEDLTFLLPGQQPKRIRTRFQLAQTPIYFIILVLLPDGLPTPGLLESPTPYPGAQRPSPVHGPSVLTSSPYGEPLQAGPATVGRPDTALSSPYQALSFGGPAASHRPERPPTRLIAPGVNPLASEPSSLTRMSPSSSAVAREGQVAAQSVTRQSPQAQFPPSVSAEEYRESLQLPPIRSPGLPSSTNPGSTKRRRDQTEEGEGAEESGQQPQQQPQSGRGKKRQRVSVEEILE